MLVKHATAWFQTYDRDSFFRGNYRSLSGHARLLAHTSESSSAARGFIPLCDIYFLLSYIFKRRWSTDA